MNRPLRRVQIRKPDIYPDANPGRQMIPSPHSEQMNPAADPALISRQALMLLDLTDLPLDRGVANQGCGFAQHEYQAHLRPGGCEAPVRPGMRRRQATPRGGKGP